MLVGGFGRPGQRDLDLGRQLVSYLQQLDWPDGVIVEDLSYAAPLVLHRLQELLPGKVLLLGAVPRGADEAGSLRRYRVDVTPPRPEEVQQRLEESVQGMVDLDHTLAVARHWGGLPVDTVVVEVEPADCSFGIGFSDDMAQVFDPVVAMVREELGDAESATFTFDRDEPRVTTPSPGRAISEMAEYAARHKEARLVAGRRSTPPTVTEVLGRPTAGRSRPWTPGVGSGSDWCEAIALDDRLMAIVAGDVPGRGVEAVGAMTELRAAARAYAAIDGHSPSAVMNHLDRFVHGGGLAEKATLLYLTLDSATGELRFTNAGHCPPLLVSADRQEATFLRDAESVALGITPNGGRIETTVYPDEGTTLVAYSDGLVTSRTRSRRDGLEALRHAAVTGPRAIEDLSDHVMHTCLAGMRRDDDVALLAVELPSQDRSRRPHEHRPGTSPAPARLSS
jgi:hydrogenase maturation protease